MFAPVPESLFLFSVPKARYFLKNWLPILIWMLVIFSASADRESVRHSSRIIGPLLHWLLPNLSAHHIDQTVTVARKCAHLTEYAILAILFWRAARPLTRSNREIWNWKLAGASILFVTLYAATDEFHQRFVPGRGPSLHDVVIDTIGAAGGIFFLWLIWKWRFKRSGAEVPKTSPA